MEKTSLKKLTFNNGYDVACRICAKYLKRKFDLSHDRLIVEAKELLSDYTKPDKHGNLNIKFVRNGDITYILFRNGATNHRGDNLYSVCNSILNCNIANKYYGGYFGLHDINTIPRLKDYKKQLRGVWQYCGLLGMGVMHKKAMSNLFNNRVACKYSMPEKIRLYK